MPLPVTAPHTHIFRWSTKRCAACGYAGLARETLPGGSKGLVVFAEGDAPSDDQWKPWGGMMGGISVRALPAGYDYVPPPEPKPQPPAAAKPVRGAAP
jgi:hypothetical protein